MLNITPLISEDGKNLSLGRLAFWITFIILITYWLYIYPFVNKDVPESLTTAFISALGYNLGKKFVKQNANKKNKETIQQQQE